MIGPVEKDVVQRLFDEGALSDTSLVWNDSFGSEWRRIGDILDFRKTDGPPPLPLTAINDFWIWAIVAVPLIGSFVEHIIQSNGEDITGAIVAYFIANSLFCYLDEKSIRNSGRKTPVSWGIGSLLVPAYLFIRAKRLGKSQITLMAWIAALIAAAYIPQTMGSFYLGLGVPDCESAASIAQVKEIFPKIPINIAHLLAKDLQDIKTISNTDKHRSCSAIVVVSNGARIPVRFTIDEVDGNFQYYLSIMN